MLQQSERLRLSYLYGGEVVYQPGETLGPRLLTDFECVYIISGEVTYTANGESFTAPPGSILMGLPNTREHYRWDPGQPTRHAYFHFGIETVPADCPDISQWPRVQSKPAPLVVSLFRHILLHIYEHTNWPAEPPDARNCMMMEILIDTYLEAHSGPRSFEQDRPEPVRRALKWMRQQIDEDPCKHFSLDNLAMAAGCTPKHLCRVFSQSIGHSPAHTGTLMRLQLAVALLTRSNLSVKEVALRCGFENPLYFTRRFSKVFGRSPSDVRTGISNGIPPPSDPLPVDITPRVYW